MSESHTTNTRVDLAHEEMSPLPPTDDNQASYGRALDYMSGGVVGEPTTAGLGSPRGYHHITIVIANIYYMFVKGAK
jgi:hypothetical protein